MNSRQRVLKTFSFEPTDRPPFDLMEGWIWPELLDYFKLNYGLENNDQVTEYLDPDFRWTWVEYVGPQPDAGETAAPVEASRTYTVKVMDGPLAHAETEADLDAYTYVNPDWYQPPDFRGLRQRFPEKALAFCPGWMPPFWSAVNAFGMEGALTKMLTQPDLFHAFSRRHHQRFMQILRCLAQAARGVMDVAWIGDDFSSQQNMILSPALWRKMIKPYLAEQVRLMREHGLLVLFHSCGAVRPILQDLIEMGVNGHLVFQTTARGMDAPSIAKEFGGRLAFYGGIDIQQLLSFGTPEQVRAEVRANVEAFAPYGGYFVANSHHCIATIKGENVIAMCAAARDWKTG
jgi:uroporphyrinogen decarboxylase